jgi:branched-chain amino acid transport system permease protein
LDDHGQGSSVIFVFHRRFYFYPLHLLLIGLYTLFKIQLGPACVPPLWIKDCCLTGVDATLHHQPHFRSHKRYVAGAAGSCGVRPQWLVFYFIGFIPGIKAFTAAVLGGIGNLPGAMLGGLVLGIVESMGPAALGINFQLKDVLAFLILIIVLTFRPSGLLGEKLAEEKV